MSGVIKLKISYANKKVEKYFEDYEEMKKKIKPEWVRLIKKHMDRLRAADTFGDFLKLGLGHPELLTGNNAGKYSLHVTGDTVMICEEVVMEGVVDYHGGKTTRYIP